MAKVRWGMALAGACMVAALGAAPARAADAAQGAELGAQQLVAVLRASAGENKQDEALMPWGPVRAPLPGGGEVEIDASWYHYLGDMHIRLVFDGPQNFQSATAQDLARLRLDTQQALALASANLRRLYGAPQVRPHGSGLMRVEGRASDLSSSYFLDRAFWSELERAHPRGLVAALPLHGGLVFADAADAAAVDALRFSAVAWYAGSPRGRLSSALYLFKDGRWTVFQPPLSP